MASIDRMVKERVWKRDGGRCVVCNSPYTASPCGFYHSREDLGYITEENMVTLCMACKCDYDNSPKRPYYRHLIRMYLKHRYPDWNEEKLYYHEGGTNDVQNGIDRQRM